MFGDKKEEIIVKKSKRRLWQSWAVCQLCDIKKHLLSCNKCRWCLQFHDHSSSQQNLEFLNTGVWSHSTLLYSRVGKHKPHSCKLPTEYDKRLDKIKRLDQNLITIAFDTSTVDWHTIIVQQKIYHDNIEPCQMCVCVDVKMQFQKFQFFRPGLITIFCEEFCSLSTAVYDASIALIDNAVWQE